MRRFIACFIASCISLCIAFSTAFAIDLGVETGRDQRLERDKSLSTKNNKEKRENTGKKKSETSSSGTDHQTMDALRESRQKMGSGNADIILSLDNIFVSKLAGMEAEEPILSSNILSHPRLIGDFYRSKIPTFINGISNNLANSYVPELVDVQKLQVYISDLALYGAIVGQAYLYLVDDLAAVKAKASKDEEGNTVIHDLGYDDFIFLADAALKNSVKNGIVNPRIKQVYSLITNNLAICRFAGSTSIIQCGAATVTLKAQPELVATGITVFGNGQYMGYSGTYRVSNGWSYSRAIENLKSTTEYSKFANEVTKFTDNITSKGWAREAIMLKKIAWAEAASGKTSLSLAKLIPGIQ